MTEWGPQKWLSTELLDLSPLLGLEVETGVRHEGLG